MTKKRTKEPWMSGAEYGRRMPPFTVDLIVADVARSVRFYTDVLCAETEYADEDFAALRLAGLDFILHADHAYDHHSLYENLAPSGKRGSGAMLRLLGVDPDDVERRARSAGAEIVQPVGDRGHGWRDVIVADPDGYAWAVGILLPIP
jgi:catechol 2,3-dioxygenase-like lactoylglutathione lyase family enzyme